MPIPSLLAGGVTAIVTRLLCRVVSRSEAPLPDAPAVYVANLPSYLGPFLLRRFLPPRTRFLVPENTRNHPALKAFFDADPEAYPVAAKTGGTRPGEELDPSLMADGWSICVFPEGQPSRVGIMLPFRRGFEEVTRRVGCPVVPVNVDMPRQTPYEVGTWRGLWRLLRGARWDVTVSTGRSLPSDVTAPEVKQALQRLEADAFGIRRVVNSTLTETAIRTARRAWFRQGMVDSTGRELTFGRFVTGCYLISRWLETRVDEPRVGILLPSTAAGALVNVAVMLMGRIPVNLNFTSSTEAMTSAVETCGIRKIVTSRVFLDKVPVKAPADFIYLEDMRRDVRPARAALAFIGLTLLPAWALVRVLHRRRPKPHDTAVVLFSSGSTGIPKGVMLSHANILANVDSIRQVFETNKDDCVLGALPFFHAFGLTLTLWLPLVLGVKAAYHPNPTEATEIGNLAECHRTTLLISTPAFCGLYVNRVPAHQFATLRFGFVGAEKLKPPLALAFRTTYGVSLFEGYGATECAPVITGNLPTLVGEGVRQRANRFGSIGHPIPGVAVRVVHPETGEPVPFASDGLLLVHGPNVMQGYLNDPESTAKVMRDGWYVTGDVVRLAPDGFLWITGRLSRFSKIGGEMVPHGRIEDVIQDYTGEAEQVIGVTAVPSEERGERIVVLHSVDVDPQGIAARMREDGYPNLWIPRRDSYLPVKSLPLLPTGKLNLGELRTLAGEQFAEQEQA